ncbi:zona pellucida sperm-binding protein 3 receptor-like isoform X2 [Alosa sapidissima]|uniref:zona pellucida sperm-binding protein 3 receptor-like isoform X2 n=1 Tax=Alosa sapidissima TaxID=34773 RepID=UPI001C093336|nr:zona pellucida sperm-binding protein 3 receptor-like isoform X2 [Alosa sapidissima]
MCQLSVGLQRSGCGPPPQVEHTKPIEQTVFPVNHTMRYECEHGFKRKAGTSSLIKCKTTGWESKLNLTCIESRNGRYRAESKTKIPNRGKE